MRASDLVYGKTFHGKILLEEATELLEAALEPGTAINTTDTVHLKNPCQVW
jgi:hypothetical protein